ncbi:MAG TPA: Gfo/Idh/MocA family oxidoreductase, partial [Puia sp.]|nr:Gfo/Idh/MocA family oxidoreductase [Puia sp.]
MNHERPEKRSRRNFLQKLGGGSFLLSTGTIPSLQPGDDYHQHLLEIPHRISPNDTLQIGCIGMGIMGFNDSDAAIQVPGVKLVAACDLYTGRLQRAKEVYGQDLATTRDYREILDRKDIDAVIIATNDSWHARIATEALGKGK